MMEKSFELQVSNRNMIKDIESESLRGESHGRPFWSKAKFQAQEKALEIR